MLVDNPLVYRRGDWGTEEEEPGAITLVEHNDEDAIEGEFRNSLLAEGAEVVPARPTVARVAACFARVAASAWVLFFWLRFSLTLAFAVGVTRRWLVAIPFALELLLVGIGFFVWSMFSRKVWVMLLVLLIEMPGEVALNVILLQGRNHLFLEPTGAVTESGTYMYSVFNATIAFSSLSFSAQAICFVSCIVLMCVRRRKKATDDDVACPAKCPPCTRASALFSRWGCFERGKRTRRTRNIALVFFACWLLVGLGFLAYGMYDTGLNMEPCPDEDCYTKCDPLDTTMCILPFPSSYFLDADATTATGYRVSFGDKTFPALRNGRRVVTTAWNQLDGFSTIAPLLFYLDGAQLTGMVTHDNITAYLNTNVKTVIVDVSTGQRVPHFVELDELGDDKLLIVQPAEPLRHNSHYVVGVRRVVGNDGLVLPATAGFAVYQRGGPASDARTDVFDSLIFPALGDQGFTRAELQLAWDFRTVSRNSSLGDLEYMRDEAERIIQSEGITYSITKTVADVCDGSVGKGTFLYGTMHAPNFLEQPYRGHPLNRDSAFHPVANGRVNVEFLVFVPCSLQTSPSGGASMIMQYGHGLFGDRTEIKSQYLKDLANANRWVICALDWWGFSRFDLVDMIGVLMARPSSFMTTIETAMQGFVNKASMLSLITGPLAADPALTFNGVRVITASTPTPVYYGNSQGGIMGGGYFAFSTVIKRGLVGVPGTPFALLLSRSADFVRYHLIMNFQFYEQRDIRLAITLMQQLWDRVESAGWLRIMNEPMRSGEKKQVLIQAALGDAQVTTLGAQIMARAYGASTVAQQTRPVFGVQEMVAPFNGSALVEWVYADVPEAPFGNTAPLKEFDTHECPRREVRAQEQMIVFFNTGVIIQPCNGICESPNRDVCED